MISLLESVIFTNQKPRLDLAFYKKNGILSAKTSFSVNFIQEKASR